MELEALLSQVEHPVLIVSSLIGRGSFSVGEAFEERLKSNGPVRHVPLESFSPAAVVREDVERYRRIVDRFPALLHLIYRFPPIYYRKYLREKLLAEADLTNLERCIEETGAKTVIGISHRPTFWLSALKRRKNLKVEIVGVATDFGPSLAWRYLFWNQVSRLLAAYPHPGRHFRLPPNVQPSEISLPVRRRFLDLATTKGDPKQTLVMSGFWGLGASDLVVAELLRGANDTTVHVACGENQELFDRVSQRFAGDARVQPFVGISNLEPYYRRCGSVITKPGFSSLVESHAARRQIFLLRGLPVTEDMNARHAISAFGGRWFSAEAFAAWQRAQAGKG